MTTSQKAVAKKIAVRTASSSAGKKYAQTRPAPKPPVKSTPNDSGGSLPVKKTAQKVVRGGKKTYAASFDSKFAPRQKPQKSVVTYRHIIAAEFWVGLLFILTRPKSSKLKENELIQAAAFILMMGILFMISGMGKNPAKMAAAFGGLVVLVVLMQDMSDGRFAAVTTDPNAPKDSGKSADSAAAPKPSGKGVGTPTGRTKVI